MKKPVFERAISWPFAPRALLANLFFLAIILAAPYLVTHSPDLSVAIALVFGSILLLFWLWSLIMVLLYRVGRRIIVTTDCVEIRHKDRLEWTWNLPDIRSVTVVTYQVPARNRLKAGRGRDGTIIPAVEPFYCTQGESGVVLEFKTADRPAAFLPCNQPDALSTAITSRLTPAA